MIGVNIKLAFLLWLLNYTSAQDRNCDYSQNVQVGTTYYVYNTNYPRNYSAGVQCRWIAECPTGYNCRIDCPEIRIPSSPSCSLDRLLISSSGDAQLNAAETYCGVGTASAISTGQKLSIGLIASKSSTGGAFYCELTAQAVTPSIPTCQCGVRRQNRIVGGQETGVNEFPMMVGLADVQIRQIKCGAVLISPRHVLTAAHCVQNRTVTDFAVIVGEHDVTKGESPATKGYIIQKITIHPLFESKNYDYDIAVVTTAQEIEFNDRVGPTCLPFKFKSQDLSGKKVTALGWGTQFIGGPTSNVLMKVDLDVISQSTCRSQVSSLTARQMCTFTRGKDSCQDDSGGPILYTDPATGLLFNVGIISYGRFCASNEPGVNARITEVLDWITQTAPYDYCRK